MSRITVNAATYAAQKMANVVFNEKIDEAQKRLYDYTDYLYESKVPQEIRSVAVMYPERVSTGRVIQFDNVDFGVLTTSTSTPHINLRPVNLSDSEYKKLEKLRDEFNDVRNDRVKYLNAVAKYLVSLKTITAVKKEFPEALEYLGESPDDNSDGPYSELRKKIQQAKTDV